MKRSFLCLTFAAAAGIAVAAVARADEASERRAAVRKATKEANDLLRKLSVEKDEARRAEIGARVDAIALESRLPAFLEGIKADRSPAVQRHCVGRIRTLAIPGLAPHLGWLATSAGAPADIRGEAHAAACALDRDLSRRWYEHATVRDFGSRRTLALDHLAEIAEPASVPVLAAVVATVGLEIRVQVARLRGVDTVPVNLGSGGNAATAVPIQLPSIDLIDVQTFTKVPALVEMGWKDSALKGLRTIAGSDLGTDPERYLAWWREQGSPGAPKPPAGR